MTKIEAIAYYKSLIKEYIENIPYFRELLRNLGEDIIIDRSYRSLIRDMIEESYDQIYKYEMNKNESVDVQMHWGSYRCAITSDDCDYVLKFTYEKEVRRVRGVRKMCDDCETEVEVYKLAKERGVDDFFAEVYSIDRKDFVIDGIDFELPQFYLAEAACPDEDRFYEYVEVDNVADVEEYEIDNQCDGGLDVFVDYYYHRPEILNKFIKFCKEIQLQDMHDENVGFKYGDDERGIPVVIDYGISSSPK